MIGGEFITFEEALMIDDLRISANDERFFGSTDAVTIQNAVSYAKKNGYSEVVIPSRNARTGKSLWVIDRAILLPSEMTVFLENAHLVMAEGVWENMFRNDNAFTDLGCTMEGEQHDIRIIGLGHSVLDGGIANGLCEQLHRDDPEHYPSMFVNLTVFFHNVRNFELRNLQFVNSRYWAVNFLYCRWGKLIDLDFREYGTMENQDGIDLRVGCEYVTVENITGITGDDTVAMTALPVGARFLKVQGKSDDIHDITIRNIESSVHGCAQVRFLCEDGASIYNVTIDGIKDTGRSIGGAAVFFGTGSTIFTHIHPRYMGEFRNIVVRNVFTTAQRGIDLAEPCQNVTIENLHCFGRNEVGIRASKNFVADNVQIRNVSICPDPASHPDAGNCAFDIRVEDLDALSGLKVHNVRISGEKYIFRGTEIPVEDLRFEAPSEGYHTAETPKLHSSYGRYFKEAYGKEIENRPADNRFGGGLRVEDEML